MLYRLCHPPSPHISATRVYSTVLGLSRSRYGDLIVVKTMYHLKTLVACCFLLSTLTSCAVQHVAIYCEPQNAAIYVNGEYLGNGIINYAIPRKCKHIVVSCSEDGISFIHQEFCSRELPSSINLYLEEYKTYSSDYKSLTIH